MSFFQIVLCRYRYIVITLSLSLVSCSHFKNTTTNNGNEISKSLSTPERSVAQNHIPRSMIGNNAYYVPMQRSPQQNFDELKQKLNSGRALNEREMGNLFRALERGADPGNLYTLAELVDPSARDIKGNTLLHWAVSDKGVIEGKRLFNGAPLSSLIEKSDVTIRNKAGKKALDVAQASETEITLWVLEELSEATRNGRAILSTREMDNLFRVLERVGRLGNLYTLAELVGPFSRDSKGNTLLHWAVSDKGIVAGERLFNGAPLSSLIEKSDVTIRNKAGETALDIANKEEKRIDEISREYNEREAALDIVRRQTITPWVHEELVKASEGNSSSSQEKLKSARGNFNLLSRQNRRLELDRVVKAAENKILEEAGLERNEIFEKGGCPY